jgi:adenosylmethionine-8-amino-7-oxononanoate aminotransferase
VLESNARLAERMRQACADLQDHPRVAEVRQCGMILAIEIVRDKRGRAHYPWQERRGLAACRYALERGVLLRPLGDVVYFMPPYVITLDEIDLMVAAARAGIEHATRS